MPFNRASWLEAGAQLRGCVWRGSQADARPPSPQGYEVARRIYSRFYKDSPSFKHLL
jgi:hypothetical protein